MWANSRLLLKYKCQAACFIEDVHRGQFSAALIPGFPAVCGTAYVPFLGSSLFGFALSSALQCVIRNES